MSGTNENGSAAGVEAPTAALRSNGHANGSNPFTRAVKWNAKGRVALIGPPGGGKTFTALVLARQLAGPNGKIAAIDTEHGSMAKYADLFDFDVLEMSSFSHENFTAALHAAEDANYDVVLVDSLSHFWMGKDGALEFVDTAQRRQKDKMSGWQAFRPHERAMVDDMLASPCHVIVTMRTKNDYVESVDSNGKKTRTKVGLAPVQREGLDYEFDVVAYMDPDNTLVIDKTRCPAYYQKAFSKPGPKDFTPFVEWLKGEVREPRKAPVAAITATTPAEVAQQKIDELTTSGKIIRAFAEIREELGEFVFLGVLARYGVTDAKNFRNTEDAKNCYKAMLAAQRFEQSKNQAVA